MDTLDPFSHVLKRVWRDAADEARRAFLKRSGIYLEHALNKEERRRDIIFRMQEFRSECYQAMVKKDMLVVNG